MRRFFLTIILLLVSSSLSAQERTFDREYTVTTLLNFLIPGYAQFKLGQNEAGYLYLTSIPFVYGGYYLFFDQALRNDVDTGSFRFHASLFSIKMGETLQYHSMWSYLRDYNDLNSPGGKRTGKETLWELLYAPFDPKVVFSWDVMPLYPLSSILSFQTEDFLNIYDFFRADRVDIWGIELNPYLAATLVFAYFAVLNDFVAVSEEIAFRGISLEQNGLVFSSILFGLGHLSSFALYDQIDAEAILDVSRQVLFTTLIGFWQGMTTVKNGYKFKQAVAYHFWHNTTNMFLATLSEIGSNSITGGMSGLSLRIPLLSISF